MAALILYDGVCGLCNKSVAFILKRDRQAHFNFASLQSQFGRDALISQKLPLELSESPESLIVIEDGRAHFKSDAALRIASHLSGAWPLLRCFRLFPIALRDFVYGVIAKNRYKWFGKLDACPLPSPEWRARFRDQ
ncbi:MAG: DUF393 domain-containing protein [Methylotenera sp.]|nr:DUF393 domain-containing protein [Oligoflexia bacterium]